MLQDRWICIDRPASALMALGVWECSNCGRRVIALGINESDNMDPSIINYRFCPYCGKEKFEVH